MKALCHVMPFHTGWHTPSLRALHDPGALQGAAERLGHSAESDLLFPHLSEEIVDSDLCNEPHPKTWVFYVVMYKLFI